MRAAVAEAIHEPVRVRDDVTLIEPGPHEVRVRLHASGICRSDLSTIDGVLAQPMPVVLGHEGAGEIVAVGSQVAAAQVGDRVVLAWIAPCGACRHCLRGEAHLCTVHVKAGWARPRFRLGDTPAFGMAGCGTWAQETVVPEAAAIEVGADVPYEIAALLGCGVTTGVGAVVNTAGVRPGESVLIVGCGGVGLSAIQGARLAGAGLIVAVDPVPAKHGLARNFGATAACAPADVGATLKSLGLGRGADHGFDVVGRPETIRAAWDGTRRGGTVVVVGAGGAARDVCFSASELLFDGKRLLGALYGSADVRRDFATLIGLWRAGRLDLAAMVSSTIALDEVDEGLRRLRAGDAVRHLVTFG
ncbi:alcohol dehydrogenase catalytic domain-containing protein [Actinoplanes sp. NPDC049118]|uniref:alcohol dehydrogenase catalytic domain-containing protein n=1 Tax=Actinoplanes sp. NPDC049118 TaxID=3155769 RepID=UPI0033CD2636